ncbi:MAG: polyprenyl synthetase family protein [Candidatus Accumulibacter sp.]|jgi:farnesyl diphosphate synthase|nr:polyprenyl synthetase family protein [Accumulibacter sp.]
MSVCVEGGKPPFDEWTHSIRLRIEAALARLLPHEGTPPERLHRAMRYACLGGGKRIRPLLAFAAGEVSGAAPDRLEIVSCAVEMIHIYSLVHDDLPCMDDDALRHGRPACHIEFGEASALLVGDALQSLAFELLSHECLGPRRSEMLGLLARASGSLGMAGGQAIDLAAVGQDIRLEELERMHAFKTGALIRAAVLLGVFCGAPLDSEETALLERFVKSAGLLFQVVDDILDCTASTALLGKTAGKDAVANKPTYVSLIGLSEARAFAESLHSLAAGALAPFGGRGGRLREIVDFIVKREF